MTSVGQMVSSQSGILLKVAGKSLTQDYGKPLFMWIITHIAAMTTSWESPQLNRPSMKINIMSAWGPHMGPGFLPTGRTLGDYNSLYFRRNSNIVDNRSVTIGCDPTTRRWLMNVVPRYLPWVSVLSSFTPSDCVQSTWAPCYGHSHSNQPVRVTTTLRGMSTEKFRT